MALFKYPSWFRFMWVSDKDIMEQVKGRKRIDLPADEADALFRSSALGEFLRRDGDMSPCKVVIIGIQ